MEHSAIIHLYLLVSLVVGVAVADGQLVDEVQLRPEEEDEHRVVLGRFFASNGQFQAARTIDRKDEAVSDSAALSGRIRHWKSDRRKKRSAAAEIPISSVNQQHPTGSSGSQTFPALSLAPAVPPEEDPSSSSGPLNETTEETTKLAAELHGLSTTSTETTTAATTTTEISIIKDIVESVDESESIPELNDAPVITSNQSVVEQHEDDPESSASTVEPEDSSESSSVDKATEIPVAPPTAAAVAVAVNRSAADDRQPAATWSTTRPSGRALSHEEEPLPWEAMSTKVIGTIIEDIQPFNNAATTAATALTTGAIAAIVMCLLLSIVTTAGLSGYWWYRKRYTNRPETLSERYAPSETGIGSTGSGSGSGFGGDDIFRVGYIHSPEMPRDSSEEMYSLDNDSFLTSLEAMTIPTYWTENIKHTKL